jgi:SH3-like domain-containing protein
MFKINSFINFGLYKFKEINICISSYIILFSTILFLSDIALSNDMNIKNSINGSGLKLPRIVSTKNSLTYFRTGPGREFPIKYELRQRSYPLEIVAEFNNWRKVRTQDNLNGWVHTQLLSSFKSGLIVNDTLLKRVPSSKSLTKAKLLKGLLIKIKKCKVQWCKIEINHENHFIGWVQKEKIWGATEK